MNERNVYVISHSSARRPRRPAALLLLAFFIGGAVCLLVFLFPRSGGERGALGFSGGRVYLLVTAEEDTRTAALAAAADTAARGGAGYLYNDGKYRVVAAAYVSGAEAEAVSELNPGSYVLGVDLPSSGGADGALLTYIAGEWLQGVGDIAAELDRGKITEAAAEYRFFSAAKRLTELIERTGRSGLLGSALAAEPDGRSVLSHLRFVQARAILAVVTELKG